MKTMDTTMKTVVVVLLFELLQCFFLAGCSARTSFRSSREINSPNIAYPEVKLVVGNNKQATMENGIIGVTLSIPDGNIIGISYNGIDNVLEARNTYTNRGYFDIVWNDSNYLGFSGDKFSVIEQNENQVEVSFSSTWNMDRSNIPLNIDLRYILRRGTSGLYIYAILKRSEKFPALEIDHIRSVFRLQQDRFHYMAIADDRQRVMPTAEDRATGQRLDYDEAVLITHPSNPELKGEVDDKYQYSCESKDNRLHGWINMDSASNKSVGFWMITPSIEFRNGGPTHQGLTSHVGPVTLNILLTHHYAGKEVAMAFQEGEPFNKVYGPFFVYLNSVPNGHDSQALWTNAAQQLSAEINSWPYDFPKSIDYFQPNQRGTVEGTLLVQDRYINGGRSAFANNAYVGLALPGDIGSWQRQSKGYQFWTQADNNGRFSIKNVVPGDYNLYAWVPGIFGDYKFTTNINITPGRVIQLGSLMFNPPRNGPTIWEIGIPDRSAAEFYVPDPYPNLINRVFVGKPKHNFRQYGLWRRYSELYPKGDLVFNVGASNYSKDWFYAQVTRNVNGKFQPTTWEIRFHLLVVISGNYTLQLALAEATTSNLMVRVNDPLTLTPLFSTGLIGLDNAIARHGIHGLHWPYSIEVPSHLLVQGQNTIYLRQSRGEGLFEGVMYDYIRLEGPETSRI